MHFTLKHLFSAAAIVLTFVGYVPYIRSVLKGEAKPHAFSWIIWGATTFLVFCAQLAASGGLGAWPIGVSGIITFYVAALAYRMRSDFEIRAIDWVFLILALSSLPAWLMTDDPLWAVVILTAVDLLGFGPTLRKAYHRPFEEDLVFFGIFTLRNAVSLPALESYSITTLLFPVMTGLGCIGLIILVLLRRRHARRSAH
jgi:hypothetical protein